MSSRNRCREIMSLFLIILIASACNSFSSQSGQYPGTVGTFQETGNYQINPETILSSLDNGKKDIFVPTIATPGSDVTLLPPGSFVWTQSDYLRIADAVSQLVWKEALEGWNVYYVAFVRECQEDPHGFDSLEITYFKTTKVKSKNVYTARIIEISPLASEVSWGGESNFPRPFFGDWNHIDLTKSIITADKALEIAEENGGKDARSKVKNNCNILVRAPNDNRSNWDVYYYPNIQFEVTIDPDTGKYKIVH